MACRWVGRRVIALAEDGVRQVVDVAGADAVMLIHVGVGLVADGIELAMKYTPSWVTA